MAPKIKLCVINNNKFQYFSNSKYFYFPNEILKKNYSSYNYRTNLRTKKKTFDLDMSNVC